MALGAEPESHRHSYGKPATHSRHAIVAMTHAVKGLNEQSGKAAGSVTVRFVGAMLTYAEP